MARNRKRRSDGAPTQPGGRGAEPSSATASAVRRGRDETEPEQEHRKPEGEQREPEPAIGQAGVDPAMGEAGEVTGHGGYDDFDEERYDDSDGDEEDLEDDGRGGGGGGTARGWRRGGEEPGGESGGEGAIVPAHPSSPSPWVGARVLQFLQGSWRELQRVQWPDRPQVMQATGVVIGFVIVAGVFLGVSDFVATKVVNFILK